MANPTNAEALKAWELNASFWDQHMGYEGNDYYRIVELPSLERMAAVKPGDRALDLATGNGLVARWLASNGARVIATDGSQAMIDHAKHRSTNANGENVNSISYQILDATSTQSFENFIAKETAEEGPFDIVVMNMAIMDIATLEPLAAALPKLLKQNTGRFVATLLHPLITAGSTRVLEYGDSRETGREEEHYTFHRPIHDVLSPFLRSGLVLDAFEEPDFDPEYNNSKQIDPRSLRYVTEIPKILAFRMRAIGY
ncbi:conserved hypothetical protein [Histoplasma capsulatum G186AR]|uniref:Methyltransferase domain-containing protein n=1 Tax=Ajellomyces capsulatus (strain G186AR / H82 / ATCC MYA-2454 / RMSCC 2432) TaxID=447093 RepID=C0NVC2_AJECG|nr:uncharacterized protein HCBG_07102 [Histoplasma capsulatum G186AR]EEH04461.1 conserved hypothetical protein [Histoplasma capsulatum G186AR]